MPRKLPPDPSEKPQIDRFAETAKAIGADETDERLKGAIRVIAPLAVDKRKDDKPKT